MFFWEKMISENKSNSAVFMERIRIWKINMNFRKNMRGKMKTTRILEDASALAPLELPQAPQDEVWSILKPCRTLKNRGLHSLCLPYSSSLQYGTVSLRILFTLYLDRYVFIGLLHLLIFCSISAWTNVTKMWSLLHPLMISIDHHVTISAIMTPGSAKNTCCYNIMPLDGSLLSIFFWMIWTIMFANISKQGGCSRICRVLSS